MDEIHFYRSSDKIYGCFSNLYRRSVEFEGVVYQTSEHAYQAGKARKPEVRDWVLSAPSPALVAMAAHGLYWWDIRSDWSKIKFDRMRQVLRAKFTQHEDLCKVLLATGDKRLVESATVDNAVNRLWGEVKGQGKNMLGQMLMELRTQLRQEKLAASALKPRARRSSRERLAA
ncbi:NADAR family protein [Hydrogenophaga sp.]|uniref:NADAR family protein n=1 Tax=Hydrogenophaga sp. TaxID=1904254 RepID=UPI003F70B011